MSIERLHFSLGDIHPDMRGPISHLAATCRTRLFTHEGTDYMLEPFEGYRLPERQDYLLSVEKTTKVGKWQSAHQYGLAVDFACRAIDQHGRAAGWFWPQHEGMWNFLKREASEFGLRVPISWDRGHVEHHIWGRLQIRAR